MITKLTVKGYAELKQTTVQAVYKKINKGNLKTVKEKINGKETLFILLEDEAPIDELNPSSTPNQPKEVELNPNLNPTINPSSTPNQPKEVEKVESKAEELNPNSTPNAEGTEQNLIAFLQEQLREKDKQIARLQEQTELQAQENKKKDEVIQEQLAKMNELLRNAQSLQAQSNVLLLEQSKPKEEEQGEQQEEAPPIVEVEQEAQEPKKKRSWLYRLFFGEDYNG